MKLVIDPDSVPFLSINRELEFPGVGKIPSQVRDVETLSYKFLGRDQETGPWMYIVKFPPAITSRGIATRRTGSSTWLMAGSSSRGKFLAPAASPSSPPESTTSTTS